MVEVNHPVKVVSEPKKLNLISFFVNTSCHLCCFPKPYVDLQPFQKKETVSNQNSFGCQSKIYIASVPIHREKNVVLELIVDLVEAIMEGLQNRLFGSSR